MIRIQATTGLPIPALFTSCRISHDICVHITGILWGEVTKHLVGLPGVHRKCDRNTKLYATIGCRNITQHIRMAIWIKSLKRPVHVTGLLCGEVTDHLVEFLGVLYDRKTEFVIADSPPLIQHIRIAMISHENSVHIIGTLCGETTWWRSTSFLHLPIDIWTSKWL